MPMLTNRQKVIRMASQIGGRINDKTFFLSARVRKYFSDLVMGLLKRFKTSDRITVNLVADKPEKTAYTDHRNIVINVLCGLFDGLTRPEKFLCMQGVLFHESAHCLYTDQRVVIRFVEHMRKTKEMLFEPQIPYDSLKDYLKSSNRIGSFLHIWKQIWNTLEDGYIEYRFLSEYKYPLYKDALLSMRELHKSTAKSLEDMIQNEKSEESKLFTIMNLLLYYCKYGMLNRTGKQYSDERVQAVISCIPWVDLVNGSDDPEDRMSAINTVVAVLSEYIIKYLETLPEDSAGGSNQCQQELEDNTDGTDSDAPQDGESEDSASRPIAGPPQSAPSSAGDSDSEDENSGKGGASDGDPNCNDSASSSEEQEEDISEDAIDDATNRCKKLLEQISEDEAEKDLEGQQRRTLQSENNGESYGPTHSGVTCTMERDDVIPEVLEKKWEVLKPDIERIVRSTVKGLKQVMKDRHTGGVQRGLYFGKSISPVSYSRYDKKYFQNRKLPTDSPTLSIALVIDESGSMHGERIDYARITALVTYLFCKELGVRLMIVGHTCDHNKHVYIKNYTDFKGSYDNKDLYRLMAISAKDCNRDGYALSYAVKRLEKESSDMKLAIIISDGQPNDAGYSGNVAFNDLKSIKRNASLRNIDVVAAAIGDDKEIIKTIYGEDSFLDISDLQKLPKAITDQIKKYLPKI